MAAYYNEIEPFAAQWLRNLIAAGHIAPGDVDERSIEDVAPDDIRSYAQAHFFAGIGVWSYALRNAGWPDDRPVWTGSCPCQPFSQAGKGAGFADERHLWPAWHHLIRECRPSVIFGEQVASKDVDPWIDLVFDDLEDMEYACAANPFPSASVGAPHIRDRTFFVAYANYARSQRRKRVQERAAECIARARGVAGVVADADGEQHDGSGDIWSRRRIEYSVSGNSGWLAHADHNGLETRRASAEATRHRHSIDPDGGTHRDGRPGPTNGFWRDADWLLCRDGKWRPVEPGTFPLAHGAHARVGRLRAYGNAINAEQAKIFIEVAMECLP